MASFAQIPTLVYTAVLGLDSGSAADLVRIAFGVLLIVALVILNRAPMSSALKVEAVLKPRRRLEPSEADRDRRRKT